MTTRDNTDAEDQGAETNTAEAQTPTEETPQDGRKQIWIRGLQMLILAVLFAIAEAVLWICAVLQFGWMLFTQERNTRIASFGDKLANWVAITARFQTGESEDKPFPWTDWR